MADITVSWLRYDSDLLGISLEIPVGVPRDEGSAGDLRYLLVQHETFQVAAWVGVNQALAAWRARLVNRNPQFATEASTTLCSRPARRQEAAVGPEEATGLVTDTSGNLGHLQHRIPAQVQVAVAGNLADGTPLLIAWTVTRDRREAYRTDEERFIGSIRCR